MTRFAAMGVALALVALSASCSECTGTVSCRVEPEVSYDGQVVDHATGAPVPGTRVTFARDSGVLLETDSITAVTGADGFFSLRGRAVVDGKVHGHLRIAAPLPFEPYVIREIEFATTRTRGNGGFLGRIVARPFFRFIAVIRDRKTEGAISDAVVLWKRNGGGRVDRDSMYFVSDYAGVIAWHPQVLELGDINATFELTAPGHPRTYVFTRDLPLNYIEGETKVIPLPVGMGLPYYATTVRRGLGQPLSGTTVELTRLSGVPTLPQQYTLTPNIYGSFDIGLEPQMPGSLYVLMRIVPPAPMPPETRTLAMATSDDVLKRFLGVAGYGAHAGFTAELRDAETGIKLPDQTPVRIRRVAGQPMLWPVVPPPEGDFRVVNRFGRIEYSAPTADDQGSVTYEVTVALPPPFLPDTIRGITVPSRFNDTLIDRGVYLVRRRPRQ